MDHSDYLSQLNLEYVPSATTESGNNDLASFTDSSFFDFDQFDQDALKNFQQQTIGQTETHANNNIGAFKSDGFTYLEKFVAETSFTPESFVKQEESPDVPKTTKQEQVQLLSTVDKKKRNTAASARFRVKKKLREQEMERTLKQLNERVANYNQRIQQLEMENSCLKSLIVQKNEQKSNDLLKRIKEKSLSSE